MTLTKFTVETATGDIFHYYAADDADARSKHRQERPGDTIASVDITPPPGAPLSPF